MSIGIEDKRGTTRKSHINRTPNKSINNTNGDFMRTSITIFSVRSLYSWLLVLVSEYLSVHVSLVILKDTPTQNSFPDVSTEDKINVGLKLT